MGLYKNLLSRTDAWAMDIVERLKKRPPGEVPGIASGEKLVDIEFEEIVYEKSIRNQRKSKTPRTAQEHL
jgi:hypothetical protein